MILDHLFTRTLFESQTDHITQFASNAHEEWRRKFDPTGTKPRIKKNSDGTEGDINVPFADLHPDWQKENLAAAHAAHRAVKHFGRDMEKAAEYVHNEWMKRNPKADYNAAQHVPYDDLPEDEKEKDRVHVRTMMQLMGHSPEQGVAEGILGSDPNRGQKVPGWAKGGIIGKIGRKLDPAWSDIQMTVPQHLLSKQSSVPDKKSLATKDVPKAKATSISPTRAIPKRAGTNPSHPVTKNVVKTIADKSGVAEGSDRVDSLVTDALKIMRGPEMSDAVLALKRVLGDRAYNERRGFNSFYDDKIHHMYGQRGMAENNHWHAAGVADAQRDVNRDPNRKVKTLNPRTRLKTMQDKQARHPEEVEQYSQGYRSVKQGVAESNTLMKKLHQALLQEGRVKELADDLKTMNDAEFMKKYGKAKAAIRRDMKKVDEGNANSGRRGPNSPPDNTPVKLGRVQKLKTGIKHHADSSRYGGTVPDTDDDHLLSPASRHRLHKAVTPDQQDLDEGNMPQSVIKSKQKYADMSDQEFHAAHKNKSEDDLKSMAWRHGYGKGSNHYVNRHKKGGGQLNELSTNKLAQYKTAAAADAKKADQAGDVKRGDKRFGGIVKATKKQFDNDTKKIDESRRSRQALMARIANSR
jgi:hypothetical protein